MDARDAGEISGPLVGTPAYALFNVPGLDLNNGNIHEPSAAALLGPAGLALFRRRK
jgi:hypothetical protein